MYSKNNLILTALTGVLAPTLSRSDDTWNIWTEICKLHESVHPDDTESDTYKIACDLDNEGCQASLDSDYWSITCDERGFAASSHINEKEELSNERRLARKKRYYYYSTGGGANQGSVWMLGNGSWAIASIFALLTASAF